MRQQRHLDFRSMTCIQVEKRGAEEKGTTTVRRATNIQSNYFFSDVCRGQFFDL